MQTDDRLELGELDPAAVAPVAKLTDGFRVCAARILVPNLRREKFDEAPTRVLAGWLIDAIRKKYQAPKGLTAKKTKVEKGKQAQRKRELAIAREAHQELNHKAFSAYLNSELKKLIKSNAEAYKAFNEEFRSFVAVLQEPSPETIKESQPYVFGKFAEENPSLGVLSFWDWDEKLNPEPFQSNGNK